MFTMKRILSTAFTAAIFLALAACGGQAQAQSVPSQIGYTLENHAQFGYKQTVDLLQPRAVDLVNGTFKVIDANGNEIAGSFGTASAFYNAPAFKFYVRTNYNGGYRWWNTHNMASQKCVNSDTVIVWQNGPSTTFGDGCALQAIISGLSRAVQ